MKDRAEFLKHEVERYLQHELRNLSQFKNNMDQELTNIQSNCDLVDKYMQAESTLTTWDDCELMDTKDIFLKTMEFIRNFEYEPGDYARRVKFLVEKDPNTLAVSLSTYGDLYLPESKLMVTNVQVGGNGLSSSATSSALHSSSKRGEDASGAGLMRSKSDHRLAMQYRGQDYEEGSGGRTSPVFGRKFGERKERGGRSGGTGSTTPGTPGYDPALDPDLQLLEVPSKSRFRSRFARHLQGDSSFDDSDIGRSTCRDDGPAPRLRERVLDTEDVTRGPLSGITKLLDSPRVIQRLQEVETAGTKLPKSPSVVPAQQPAPTPTVVAQAQVPNTPVAPWRSTSRQVSEEDEIAKQKKMNKEGAAAVNARAAAATPNKRQQSIEQPKTPAGTRTSTERSNALENSTAAVTERTSLDRSGVVPKNARSESSDSTGSTASTASSRNTNTGEKPTAK